MAACGRSRRRLRGPLGERRGGRGDPRGGPRPAASSAAASATLAAMEGWLEARRRPGDPRHGGAQGPALVREACRKPSRAGSPSAVDARGGRVAVEGWAETSEVSTCDLARRFEDAGVAALIFTDIDRDGLLGGVNVAATAALARGIADPGDRLGRGRRRSRISERRSRRRGIAGVIVGRALYDGRLDLRAAMAAGRAAGRVR